MIKIFKKSLRPSIYSSSVTAILVTFFIASGFVFAAWQGPTCEPPDCNLPGYIWNVFEAGKAPSKWQAQPDSGISVDTICLPDSGNCIEEWPDLAKYPELSGLWKSVDPNNPSKGIYYQGGKVGIGRSNEPGALLDIWGSALEPLLFRLYQNTDNKWLAIDLSSANTQIASNQSYQIFAGGGFAPPWNAFIQFYGTDKIFYDSTGNIDVVIKGDGNVGIGDSNPTEGKLVVSGNIVANNGASFVPRALNGVATSLIWQADNDFLVFDDALRLLLTPDFTETQRQYTGSDPLKPYYTERYDAKGVRFWFDPANGGLSEVLTITNQGDVAAKGKICDKNGCIGAGGDSLWVDSTNFISPKEQTNLRVYDSAFVSTPSPSNQDKPVIVLNNLRKGISGVCINTDSSQACTDAGENLALGASVRINTRAAQGTSTEPNIRGFDSHLVVDPDSANQTYYFAYFATIYNQSGSVVGKQKQPAGYFSNTLTSGSDLYSPSPQPQKVAGFVAQLFASDTNDEAVGLDVFRGTPQDSTAGHLWQKGTFYGVKSVIKNKGYNNTTPAKHIAVYGEAADATENWAGYFVGDVGVNGKLKIGGSNGATLYNTGAHLWLAGDPSGNSILFGENNRLFLRPGNQSRTDGRLNPGEVATVILDQWEEWKPSGTCDETGCPLDWSQSKLGQVDLGITKGNINMHGVINIDNRIRDWSNPSTIVEDVISGGNRNMINIDIGTSNASNIRGMYIGVNNNPATGPTHGMQIDARGGGSRQWLLPAQFKSVPTVADTIVNGIQIPTYSGTDNYLNTVIGIWNQINPPRSWSGESSNIKNMNTYVVKGIENKLYSSSAQRLSAQYIYGQDTWISSDAQAIYDVYGQKIDIDTNNGQNIYGVYSEVPAGRWSGYFTGGKTYIQELCLGGTGSANCKTDWGAAATGGGLWTQSGNNIYNNNTGNVGIGIVNPGNSKLQVNGGSMYTTDGILKVTGSNTASVGIKGDVGNSGAGIGIAGVGGQAGVRGDSIKSSGWPLPAGVYGSNPNAYGVIGDGLYGVYGMSGGANGIAVMAYATGNNGVGIDADAAGPGRSIAAKFDALKVGAYSRGQVGIFATNYGGDADTGSLLDSVLNSGVSYGGYFHGGSRGIYAEGSNYGGYFRDSDNTGNVYLGYDNYGVYALNNYQYTPAVFGFNDQSDSYGVLAYNNIGVYGYDIDGYGVFGISPSGYGVFGYSNDKAGYFQGNVYVTGNLNVTGDKNFIQDHPSDPTKQIVYTSLEGGESGTYTRGTGQLSNGQAVINLPEHFSLVTSEKGLTVQVTLTSEAKGLYIVSKSPQRITVKEIGGGTSNATFDYLVQGVRKGYEDRPVIVDKPKAVELPELEEQSALQKEELSPEDLRKEIERVQRAAEEFQKEREQRIPEGAEQEVGEETGGREGQEVVEDLEGSTPVAPTAPQAAPKLKWWQKVLRFFGIK